MEAKRHFTSKEFNKIVNNAVWGIKDLRKARKKDLISDELSNHIHLAVTEVNGCALCSYKHIKDALEMGMNEEQINNYLSGNLENVDKDEVVALMFAQHYAETGGKFSQDAWKHVVDTYGEEKAKGILSDTKVIMFGNAYGIELGLLGDRIKGKVNKNSKLKDELGVVFSIFAFLPAAIIHNVFRNRR